VKDAVAGVVLTAIAAMIVGLAWDGYAAIPAAGFGLLATAIDVVAVAFMRRGLRGDFKRTVEGWAVGMGLRMGGAAVLIAAMLLAPERFPPLPSTIGFVGVLLPLLFYEMRLLR